MVPLEGHSHQPPGTLPCCPGSLVNSLCHFKPSSLSPVFKPSPLPPHNTVVLRWKLPQLAAPQPTGPLPSIPPSPNSQLQTSPPLLRTPPPSSSSELLLHPSPLPFLHLQLRTRTFPSTLNHALRSPTRYKKKKNENSPSQSPHPLQVVLL